MNIGETSATLPVIDALAGAAVAAPVEGAAGFADRLAEALGAVSVAAPGAAVLAREGAVAAVSPEGMAGLSDAAQAAPCVARREGLALPFAGVPLETTGAGVALLAGDGPGVAVADLSVALAAPVQAGDTDPDLPVERAGGDVAATPVAMVPATPVATAPEGAVEDGAQAKSEDAPPEEAEGSETAAGSVVLAVASLPVPVAVPVVLPVAVAVEHVDAMPDALAAAPQDEALADKKPMRGLALPLPKGGAGSAMVTVALETGIGLAAAPDLGAAGAGAPDGVEKAAVPDGAVRAEAGAGEAGAERPAKLARAEAAADLTQPVPARTLGAGVALAAAAPKPEAGAERGAETSGDAAGALPDALARAAASPLVQTAAPALAQTAERAALPGLRIDLPGWEQVLNERIAADLSEDGQEIELALAPEKLGPLRIRLEMVDGAAQVKIITATPEAARVFHEAQHRLTEGLARAGIELGSQSAESGSGGAQAESRSAPRGRMSEFMTQTRRIEAADAPLSRRAGAGLVNLMA